MKINKPENLDITQMDLTLITTKEYKRLLKDSLKLAALESGGVDNWDWYGASLCDFLDEEGVEDFDELVEKDMATMVTVPIDLDEKE